VEQFEQIRRDHAREGLSIRALAKRHGVHRRAVRQALASPVPPPKRRPEYRPAPKLGPYRVLIDEWLAADLRAPRKQRHTARRVWQRLRAEHGADVSELQVDRYVASRRRMMGEVEAFVPLVSDAGVEAEVDWGQAQVILRGEPVEVHVFLDARVPFGRVVRGGFPGRDPAGVPRGAKGVSRAHTKRAAWRARSAVFVGATWSRCRRSVA
jgi:transposase